jgi:peptidoglycan/xylan/chitin deacetylase (PgdA/CDA1 family)
MKAHQIPYSPLVDRPPLRWPNGARVALWTEVALEHFEYDKPGMGLPPSRAVPLIPDVKNAGWRDYGNRVGIWRIMKILDKHGVRATACTNSEVGVYYPEVIREARQRNWEFQAHGLNNMRPLTGLDEDAERREIRESLDLLSETTGQRIKGWVGPGLAETPNTLDLLAEAGIEYVSDWSNDDQPHPIEVKSGRLIGVPWFADSADSYAFLGIGLPPERWYQMLCDQFDTLYDEGEQTGRVYCVSVHPFLAGQAFRAKWLDKALDYILNRDEVWVTTAAEISDWYYENVYDQALAQVRQRAEQLRDNRQAPA